MRVDNVFVKIHSLCNRVQKKVLFFFRVLQKYLKMVPFLDLDNCKDYRFWYKFVKLVSFMCENMEKRIIQELEVVNDLQISQILVCRMFT